MTARCSSPTFRAALCRCRWWWARAPRPARRDFLALLARYPQVKSVTKAAILVGERRWNLRLKDGLDVRLPENDVGNALAELSRLDKEEKLFSRDIVAVDMRLPDRLTVQLSDDAAKAREELFKDKKPKKKAGEA